MPRLMTPETALRTARILDGEDWDPFSFLGMHNASEGLDVRVFLPDARKVSIIDARNGKPAGELYRVHPEGLFAGHLEGRRKRFSYCLSVTTEQGEDIRRDPYSFGAVLGELDLHLLAEGRHEHNFKRLGAHQIVLDGVEGTVFAVWAPNARRVSVVGDFNVWDGRRNPMRVHPGSGMWEIFLPGVAPGTLYKFEIKTRTGEILLKSDPYAFQTELPPRTASVVAHPWVPPEIGTAVLPQLNYRNAPIAIYEVHLGSWRRIPEQGNRPLTYRELADSLVPYAKEMGFTHLEFMPIAEHPFDGSWGYQPTALFAPTSRYGPPEDFRALIDRCHAEGLGVILDWVPAHFPDDPHGLANFDGTHLYEHSDPREGLHPDWNTAIYNYGRNEVRNFLLSNALYWIERYGADGLRVDAVASMLYRNYSRKEGEWVPNRFGGVENLEALDFLKTLNERIYARHPNAIIFAEESTSWPMVSRPTSIGGLGFSFKWNLGWMHDTLDFMFKEPIHRKFHHDRLTFGLLYAFSENFVLPLSHDEVVHGKGSLLNKMPGDRWQKFANLRAFFAFQYTQPGKKLLFMGGEFAQEREWNHNESLDWHLLDDSLHAGMQSLVRDLNRLYCEWPALHEKDCEEEGFSWIDCHDCDSSVISYLRRGNNSSDVAIVVCNFTPVVQHGYCIGVPAGGRYRERLNTDSKHYGGGDVGNWGAVTAQAVPAHGMPYSLQLTLPPLAVIVLQSETL